jgi:hypothetical protein
MVEAAAQAIEVLAREMGAAPQRIKAADSAASK